MAAGLTFVSDKAIKAVTKAVQDSGLLNSASKAGDVLQGGVETIDDATASNITQGIVDNLDQVNVITNTGGALTNAATTLTSVAASQPSTKEPEVKVETTRDQVEAPPSVVEPPLSQEPPVEEPPPAEEEVKVETERDQPTTPVVTEPTPKSPLDEAQPEEPKEPEEEVKVETERDQPTTPVVTEPTPKSPLDEAQPEPTEEEVKVETERDQPTTPVVTTPEPSAPTTEEEVKVETERDKPTPPVVTTPTPKSPIDEATPEEEEVKVETERDKPTPPVVTTPTQPTEPSKDTDKDTDKEKSKGEGFLTLDNLLKLLGALGAGASKAPKAPVIAPPPTGGLGGALPKYTYARKQLSPDIDYYTYGTRPEARFFEDSMQLEKPVQPPLSEPESPPANPPGGTEDMVMGAQVLIPATVDGVEGYYTDSTKRTFVPNPPKADMPMATGGLTGYAKGGSKSSRYVDGPGSGREDKIPALLSDGEYVIDAETLALLGDGSTKEGARRMDKFRAKIRQHKGRALSRGRISPNAKSPEKYMGGGLT
jgi:hypothetical protein